MSLYTNILIASDMSLETLKLINRARLLSDENTKISIVHVIPPVSYTYGGISAYIPDMLDYEAVQNKIQKQKKEHVDQMIEYHKLHDVTWDIEIGKPSTVIKEYAEKNIVDLIILGSHGEKGIRALLGTTATGVLQAAPCDILCVRLFDKK